MNTDFLNFLTNLRRSPSRALHIGANAGKHVASFAAHGIETWHVEAIPSVYDVLMQTCAGYPHQHAVLACLSDVNNQHRELYLSSNNLESSSFFPLGRHSAAYPQVTYCGQINLQTTTIDALVKEKKIPSNIDFLVIGVQGAELLVLKGADTFLRESRLIGCQIETGVVPLYSGSSSYLDVATLLESYGLHLKTCTFTQEGWTDILFLKPYWPRPLSDVDLALINVMKPKPSPRPLIRIGGKQDGAYLIPDDLEGIKACFSPGVNNRKTFEDELLLEHSIPSHMCDFSSNLEMFQTPLLPGQTFTKKWLEPTPGPDNVTLQDWIAKYAPQGGDDLILQIDIEGAEYRNLLHAPRSVLQRFRIISIELHDLAVCNDSNAFNSELGPLLQTIDRDFICVHAHPNNCCGEFIVAGTPLNLPHVHELTFLRRDRFDRVPKSAYYAPQVPHPLDIPFNVPDQPPLQLNGHWQG